MSEQVSKVEKVSEQVSKRCLNRVEKGSKQMSEQNQGSKKGLNRVEKVSEQGRKGV